MKKLILLFIIFFLSLNTITYSETKHKYVIYIDVHCLTLSLIDNTSKETVKMYPIAIGSKSTPSPLGTWQVMNKATKKESIFGGYWIGLTVPWDTFGIHGTNRPDSIGQMKSNGCFRLNNSDIEELFHLVDDGTSVIIDSGPNWLFSPYVRNMKPYDRGYDVYLVQRRLNDLGYYLGEINGIYEYNLELAVLKYRCDYCLPGNSEIDRTFLDSISLPKYE